MATFPDHTGFAYSFSHARIVLNGKQYLAISNVQANVPLEEGAVFGASNKPLRRTPGQLQMGEGNVTFSDYEQANEFISDLGDKPLLKIWDMDYTLVDESGKVRSVECIACRLTAFNLDHEQGAEALTLELPFSFMTAKVNGKELI